MLYCAAPTYLRHRKCGDVLDWQIEALTETFQQGPKSESGVKIEQKSAVERINLLEVN